MRTKYLIPAILAAAAVALTGCSSDSDDVSNHVKAGKLNSHQKAVISTWYDVSSTARKKHLETLTDREVLAAVNTFTLLCVLDENRIAIELANGANGLDSESASRLADAIDDHLCEHTKKKARKTPSVPPAPSVPTGAHHAAPNSPTPSSADSNPTHDLTRPTSRHDREDMTLKAPANRQPAKAHQRLGPNHHPQAPADPKRAPVIKAPAKTLTRTTR